MSENENPKNETTASAQNGGEAGSNEQPTGLSHKMKMLIAKTLSATGLSVIAILFLIVYPALYSGVPEKAVHLEPGGVSGETFTRTIIANMDRELDHGWLPNNLKADPTYWMIDNRRNTQMGIRFAVYNFVGVMREHLARGRSSTEMNRHLVTAFEKLNFDPQSFWLPSTESQYREGLKELDLYIEDLAAGENNAYFIPRSDNMMEFFRAVTSLIGHCNEILVNLPNDRDAIDLGDGNAPRNIRTEWSKVDDNLHHCRGVLLVTLSMMYAADHEFHEVLVSNQALSEFRAAIFSLERAVGVNPWYAMNSRINGIFANHTSNMSGQIGDAKAKVTSLITILDRG